MKIKWRVAIVLILLSMTMILLESSITMTQLKENMEKESSASIINSTHQTALSFSYISDDIEQFLFNISRAEGVASTIVMSQNEWARNFQLSNFLQSITDSTAYIDSAYILDEDHGQLYTFFSNGSTVNKSEIYDYYRKGLFDNKRDIQWFSDDKGNIYVFRAIYNLHPYRRVGAVIANLNPESLFSMLGFEQVSSGFYSCIDGRGNLVINGSNDGAMKGLIQQAYEQARQAEGSIAKFTWDGELYFAHINTQDRNGWCVLYLVSEREQMASYYAMNVSIWVVGVLLCLVGVCVAPFVSGALTRRIISMKHQVKMIGEGQPEKRVEITGRDEIADLSQQFNQMLDKIESMHQRAMDQQAKEEEVRRELVELQFRSVQANIAPHFVSNLLSALNSYAAMGETYNVEQMAVHASRYFRRIVENSEQKLSTVEDEFALVEEYILLSQNIFDQPNTYSRTIADEQTRYLMMPSMLLQPLVENSLKYYRKEYGQDKTHIAISAERANDRLRLTVEDCSGTLPEDVMAAIHEVITEGCDTDQRLGFGLFGILRRLEIMYGDQYRFQVEPLENNKKKIIITIPIITETDAKLAQD